MSRLAIAILEDNLRRAVQMRARLEERLPYEVVVFSGRTSEMMDWLDQHLSETILILLDHDLELLAPENGHAVDPGTGRDVADYLSVKRPSCPVVIHSTNVAAALAMESVLSDSGWCVERVTPYGDLEWIDEAWFPIVRRAILQAATVQPVGKTEV